MAPKPATKTAAKRGQSKTSAAAQSDAAAPEAVALIPFPPTAPEPEGAYGKGAALKLKALVDRVVGATGHTRKETRDIVEATLNELGGALLRGEELNLPGLGRIRVARSTEKGGRSTVVLKMRAGGGPKQQEAKEALAEADEAV